MSDTRIYDALLAETAAARLRPFPRAATTRGQLAELFATERVYRAMDAIERARRRHLQKPAITFVCPDARGWFEPAASLPSDRPAAASVSGDALEGAATPQPFPLPIVTTDAVDDDTIILVAVDVTVDDPPMEGTCVVARTGGVDAETRPFPTSRRPYADARR